MYLLDRFGFRISLCSANPSCGPAQSIKCIMGAMHVPYRLGLAEGKAMEHENYMEMYDPKTFLAAVSALFEQRTIEFTD